MENCVLHGHICDSADMDHIRITENGFLVAENGKITGVFQTLPERFRALPYEDCGDRLIIPGMTDLHTHAPQFAFRGLGLDLELMEWLNTYTFPQEARYADLSYADRAYGRFAEHLKNSVTTRAVVFGTVHAPATELLMEKLEQTGLHTYVGRVNMDRNCPDTLRETDSRQAAADTENWYKRTKERFARTKPILTPRFIPACSDDLLERLGKLAETYHLPVQSHLSENLREIELVRKLCPTAKNYADAYDRFGLLGTNGGCIMAHCVHSDQAETELLQKNGVFIAHCPESNTNLSSGVAPINRYLDIGMNVGLGTDIAGGSHESMLRAVMFAIQASKLRWRLSDQSVKPLSFARAFYLATAGGGAFFGKVGKFAEGYAFDAVVLDDGGEVSDVRARLERAIYLADERNIYAKYAAGKQIIGVKGA